MSRAYCYKCFRAKKNCLCNKISVINNDINVYILQHSDEVKNAKGTAIIAGLYLSDCVIWKTDDEVNNKALNSLIEKEPDTTYLVYPDKNSIQLKEWGKIIKCKSDELKSNRINLILIDASWRKAKKIYHSSSVLNKITCISLDKSNASNYRIRKIPEPGYISTIEAIVVCLSSVADSKNKYQPLLGVFDKMIDSQIEDMGKQVYASHHQKTGFKDKC
jgi:tRNA-uridine aminocarboxypropyltransferase